MTRIEYAAFGKTTDGQWKQIRPAQNSQEDAELDILCFKDWWDEYAKHYVDFKVMKRKVTMEDWE